MFDVLDDYKSTGHFFFSEKDNIAESCNAPKNSVGVFLVYQLKDGRIELVYVGSSGKVSQNGRIRKDINGIYNEIIRGQHIGGERQEMWKKKLREDNIEALDIYWYETVKKDIMDIPTYVQGVILQTYLNIHGKLPKWNSEF